MNSSIRSVKKEIRILGLDTCNHRVVVGAVVRGGLYLDGIVILPVPLFTNALAKQVVATKYFPELKVLMIHDPRHNLDTNAIRRITRLPTVEVPTRDFVNRGRPLGSLDEPEPRNPAVLDESAIRKILTLTQVRGRLPEPVRIAHLLAKLHAFSGFSHDKR